MGWKMKERKMDWYACNNSQGSGEGYAEEGMSPDIYTNVACNCGGPHDWVFQGTYVTDFEQYPWNRFFIG